jgi:UDP-N-acetylmuramoylalanine--D-glutamate ligase
MEISKNWFQNKTILVFGLGLHGGGLAVTNWLLNHGSRVIVTDKKTKKELRPTLTRLNKKNVCFYLGQEPGLNLLSKIDLIIQNPGVPNEHKFLIQAKRKNIPIMNEAGLFFSLCKYPIVAITGSKGKSTTTDLLGKIVKSQFKKTLVGGNIRTTAMFTILDKIKHPTPIILELSSWQLEGLVAIKRSPELAIVTNIKQEHLNRYKSFRHYIKAKSYIFYWQKSLDKTILNFDDKETKKFGFLAKGKVYWFSLKKIVSQGVFIKNNNIYWKEKNNIEKIIAINQIKLPGLHNLQNVLATVCASKIMHIKNKNINKVLKKYKGLPDRLETVRIFNNIRFINDSTATAPVATIAALQTITGNIILIAGGSSKKLPVLNLAQEIKKKVNYCLLFKGQGSNELISALSKIKYPPTKIKTDFISMKSIVKEAVGLAKKGDVILLSPGFASFSNFINEFDRAQQFKKEIFLLK